MLLDAHTHLDHYDDATLAIALDEITAPAHAHVASQSIRRATRAPALSPRLPADPAVLWYPSVGAIASLTTWMRSSP